MMLDTLQRLVVEKDFPYASETISLQSAVVAGSVLKLTSSDEIDAVSDNHDNVYVFDELMTFDELDKLDGWIPGEVRYVWWAHNVRAGNTSITVTYKHGTTRHSRLSIQERMTEVENRG